MRPTTSTMLQQNNNNNYPCLNVSGSTREMLQKCSRASLPFPSRLELGLGDLPLIRGLRAWALCSKNRRKAGSLLGGGQAPMAPPAGRGGSTSCPRPADVYLSGEWGRMGYGLPLGLDAGQAGIGALVTVATLKTSEGSGKTQTQCLFLRTEKGSCLYSTAKPGSGSTTSAASGVVGGWLRGKTGGRDTPAGRRDNGPAPPVQTGANRIRVRSGRRWRKSCNAAGWEKTGVSRERQQGGGEDPAGGISLEERQEERDKGGLDGKQFPSPPQDSRRAKQEKEGAVRSPRCCHNSSPKACAHCGRRAPRRGSQDEHEGGESPRRGGKGMKKERQKTEEEEEEKGGLCGSESSNFVSALPNADPESRSCDVEEIRGAESNEELKTQTSHSKDDNDKEDDTNSEAEVKIESENNDFPRGRSDDFTSRHNGDFNDRKPSEAPCEEEAVKVNGFSDHEEANQESEEMMARMDVEEEEGSINQTPAETLIASSRSEDVPVSAEPSDAVEGSTCNAEHETYYVQKEQENREDGRQGAADLGVVGKEEQGISRFGQQEPNCVSDVNNTVNENKETPTFFKNAENSSRLEETEASSSPLRHEEPSVFDIDGRIVAENSKSEIKGAEHELLWENREEESHGEKTEEVVNPKEGGEAGECTCNKPDDDNEERHPEVDIYDSGVQEDDREDVRRDCALKDNWRSREPADGRRRRKSDVGDTCGQTSTSHTEANREAGTDVTDVARADPSTSLALSPANPAPSLPPLGAMATGLPCLEAEEEEEGVGVTAGDGEGGQRGKRRELEEPGQEERGSTVATGEGRKEEEEEEEEEDEFGVFMQADGEPAWSEGSTMSASVPCGSRESVALGHHAITGESTHWTPGWTDSSFHQSDDTWTAFPQDSSDERRDAAGQWWPTCAVEESRDGLSANQNLASLFAEAFPSLSGSSSGDSRDLDTVPTLTQLLGGRAGQDQGLLDSFHDLNKMICQRYKRANVVSRDLLLKTLHLQQPHAESRPAPRTANRRHSPGLPSANQHAQNAAAKRRLSYDYNRNIME